MNKLVSSAQKNDQREKSMKGTIGYARLGDVRDWEDAWEWVQANGLNWVCQDSRAELSLGRPRLE